MNGYVILPDYPAYMINERGIVRSVATRKPAKVVRRTSGGQTLVLLEGGPRPVVRSTRELYDSVSGESVDDEVERLRKLLFPEQGEK